MTSLLIGVGGTVAVLYVVVRVLFPRARRESPVSNLAWREYELSKRRAEL